MEETPAPIWYRFVGEIEILEKEEEEEGISTRKAKRNILIFPPDFLMLFRLLTLCLRPPPGSRSAQSAIVADDSVASVACQIEVDKIKGEP